MAARKLQTEIDRTLKKVAEGVELFESIYDKMQNSTNQTQKEKLETDLKTQIKKLQRLRDQIKAWVASNDIKDKSALLDNRRRIETQMEKFKACEKEMKTKAFSKEGLTAAAKLDPKAQEKLEMTQWIQTQVEELLLQVEQSEAEIETLQGGGKKKGKSGGASAERLEELEHLNERRKWHISRLELIMRLMDNGSMETEKVKALQEDVQYFVDSNTNEEFEEDEGIYDELNLDEEEEKFGLAQEEQDSSDSEENSESDLPPRTPLKKHEEDSPSSVKRDGSPVLKKAPTLQLRKPSSASETKPPPNPNFAQQPMSSILKAGLPPQPRPPATLPPIRYSAAAAGAVTQSNQQNSNVISQLSSVTPSQSTPSVPQSAPSISSSSGPGATSQDHISGTSSSPSLTHPSVTSPMLSSASANQPEDSLYSAHGSPALSDIGGPVATSSPQRVAPRPTTVSSPQLGSQSPNPSHVLPTDSQSPAVQPQVNGSSQPSAPAPQQQQQTGPSPLPQQIQQAPTMTASPATSSSLPASQSHQPQYPPGVKVPQTSTEQTDVQLHNAQQLQTSATQRPPSVVPQQQVPQHLQARTTVSSAFPGSLSDLVASFEGVKQKAVHRMSNLEHVHKLLEGGYSSAPQPQDTDKPKYYTPRNPYHTPTYYPQTPLPVLSTAGIFSQLDVETLFYIFYFHPGTYQQYLAAKELKRQSWRFHVKYLTWFQRHSEPQAITEEYEQGVYVYFDWEGSWCQRKKSDFRFEYRYLSED